MMSSPFPLGPVDAAKWESEAIGGESAYPQWLLLLPDAGNSRSADDPAVFYYLPKMPTVARGDADQPDFSLALVLSRNLETEDETLAPLIERGQLSFKIDLRVPNATLRRLQEKRRRAGRPNDSFRPLFAHSILATLDDVPRPLASSSGIGADAQIAFSASLDRAQTLAVLDALNGVPGCLRILLDIGYRAVSAEASHSRTSSACAGTAIVEQTSSTETLHMVTLEAPLDALFADLLGDNLAGRSTLLSWKVASTP